MHQVFENQNFDKSDKQVCANKDIIITEPNINNLDRHVEIVDLQDEESNIVYQIMQP